MEGAERRGAGGFKGRVRKRKEKEKWEGQKGTITSTYTANITPKTIQIQNA